MTNATSLYEGGCDCDCSWAKPDTCHTDDGSCCWSCCCNSQPGALGNFIIFSTSPATNCIVLVATTNTIVGIFTFAGPAPGPSPPGPNPGLTSYCPSKEDLTVAYGNPTIMDRGWQIKKGQLRVSVGSRSRNHRQPKLPQIDVTMIDLHVQNLFDCIIYAYTCVHIFRTSFPRFNPP